tara:strand:+ start:48 stop:1187 length:1140 start_codon:yes stop_codon:yes gene_type:complete
MEQPNENFEYKGETLSPEQQGLILEEWNRRGTDHPDGPPSLNELIKIAFPNVENADGRTKEGRIVKQFLSSRNMTARSLHDYIPKQKLELTEEHKEFIINNAGMMKGYEIARVIFQDPSLSHVSQEARTVNEYIKNSNTEINGPTFNEEEEVSENEYKPPKTFTATLHKINKYVMDGINKEKITANQKKDINSLIGYLNTFRFCYQINSYDANVSRDLFESSFIRYTYDKNDLTQEEVDQYILLSAEVVIASTIQRRVEHLQQLLDNTANDTDGARISMSLVEAINTAQNEYNQCVNRQQKLLGDLKQKRSDRLSKRISNNASILNLVEAWKDEESRKQMIQLANMQKETLEGEVEKLADMDELKCRILGLSKDEALNG